MLTFKEQTMSPYGIVGSKDYEGGLGDFSEEMQAAEKGGLGKEKLRKLALVFSSLSKNKKKTQIPDFRKGIFRKKDENAQDDWTEDFLKTVQFL